MNLRKEEQLKWKNVYCENIYEMNIIPSTNNIPPLRCPWIFWLNESKEAMRRKEQWESYPQPRRDEALSDASPIRLRTGLLSVPEQRNEGSHTFITCYPFHSVTFPTTVIEIRQSMWFCNFHYLRVPRVYNKFTRWD